jgi:hypothetical protein
VAPIASLSLSPRSINTNYNKKKQKMKTLLSTTILLAMAITFATAEEKDPAAKTKSDSSENELLMQRVNSIEQSLDSLIRTVFKQDTIAEQPAQHKDAVKKLDETEVLAKRLDAIQVSIRNISQAASSSRSDSNLVWVKTCCCVSCDQTGCGNSGTDCCHQYCCGYCYSQVQSTAH